PPEYRGQIQISITAPEGSTLAFTDEYQRQVEAILAGLPEIANYTSVVGGFGGSNGRVNSGGVYVRFVDWADRKRTAQEIIQAIQPKLSRIPGVLAFANNPPAFGWIAWMISCAVRLRSAQSTNRT